MRLGGDSRLEIVSGAGLVELVPGALEGVGALTRDLFVTHLLV